MILKVKWHDTGLKAFKFHFFPAVLSQSNRFRMVNLSLLIGCQTGNCVRTRIPVRP